jgi:hypothetical protein
MENDNKPSHDPFRNEELQATQPHPLPNGPSANKGILPQPSSTSSPHLMSGGIPRRPYNPSRPLPSPIRGDFAGDLLPGDPLRMPGQNLPAGNTMGPNHPIFQQQQPGRGVAYNPNDDYRSGFGMRPRFDPFGPPGIGPQGNFPPHRGGNPQGHRMSGEPNPGQLPPPNSLGDDMFS